VDETGYCCKKVDKPDTVAKKYINSKKVANPILYRNVDGHAKSL
jgi:hypothetical protein